MIAKGNTHGSGGKLASYIVTGKDGERAELWQMRGFDGLDLKDGFRVVEAMAAGTQCEKPFFHCQVRNPEGEDLTREQWEQVAAHIEAKIGYEDQPRAMAFHVNEETGHEHMHLVWSRIDEDAMAAKPLPFFKLRLKEVCRELEIDMGLTQVRNEREPHEPPAPKRAEMEEARRLGVDVKAVRQTIHDCWQQSDNGHAFVAALTEHDFMIAMGDRRDYVVIDDHGGLHALGKRLTGSTAAEIRVRLADLDREALPTVNAAREAMEFQTFNGLGKAAQEKPVEVPVAELGPSPDAGRAAPTGRDGHTISEPAGAPIIGKAIAQVAVAVAEVATSTAEKGLDTIADVFSFGVPSSPAPQPTQPIAMEPTKPKHDPQEDIARTLRTANRDTAADDPAARAGFATNPAAATPDIAQQIMNRWRKQREERDLER